MRPIQFIWPHLVTLQAWPPSGALPLGAVGNGWLIAEPAFPPRDYGGSGGAPAPPLNGYKIKGG